jgi:1-acyl-sn-glycerol-3-phosphate acyltransferase
MRILIQIKAIFLALFLLLFILVPVCIIASPFKIKRRLKIVSPVWAFLSHFLLRYGCHAKVAISEDHRSPQFKGTPCYGLYIANHQSFFDIPLMISIFQAPPIMKKEVLHIPIFGWMAWISGALPFSRSNSTSRRKVFEKAKKRIMEERIGLQVYPEGTRSKSSLPKGFNEIKKNLLFFAYNEKIPVIPTSIYGTRSIVASMGMIRPGRNIGIIVHREMDPSQFNSAEEFAQSCWNEVLKGHDQMKNDLELLNEN